MPSSNPGETQIWFGKHKGKRLKEIPRTYLQWMLDERVGGGEIVDDVAAVLGVDLPKRAFNPQTDTKDYGYAQQFNPSATWPGMQKWDGHSSPWEDQDGYGELNREFKGIVQ